MTGCDQLELQPEPDGRADDDRDGHAVRARRRSSKSPSRRARTTPRASELRDHADHPARGLLDQPERRRRQGRLPRLRTPIRHARRGDLPRVLEDRDARDRQSPPCPAPIPGAIYLGEPKPGDPYRCCSPPTASRPTSSCRARCARTRRPVSCDRLREPARSPRCSEFNMHFFGSERGLLATPTAVRHLPGARRLHALGLAAPRRSTSTSFFTIDSGPGGAPCPNGTRPSRRSFTAGSRRPPPGLTARSASRRARRRRPEPDRADGPAPRRVRRRP